MTLIQPSPPTTLRTTEVTSGVSLSLGGNVGYNLVEGVNATGSLGLTIQNSKTTTVPPVDITNRSGLIIPEPRWEKVINLSGRSGNVNITFFNHWIWEVPFAAYRSGPRDIDFQSLADFVVIDPNRDFTTAVLFRSKVPLLFGGTFALNLPVVTSVDPTSVSRGQTFKIAGAGLYPSLVTGVLIGGQALAQANFSTVSDTEITVVAPDKPGSAQPVVVQTTQGISNANVTIDITSPAGPTASEAAVPGHEG